MTVAPASKQTLADRARIATAAAVTAAASGARKRAELATRDCQAAEALVAAIAAEAAASVESALAAHRDPDAAALTAAAVAASISTGVRSGVGTERGFVGTALAASIVATAVVAAASAAAAVAGAAGDPKAAEAAARAVAAQFLAAATAAALVAPTVSMSGSGDDQNSAQPGWSDSGAVPSPYDTAYNRQWRAVPSRRGESVITPGEEVLLRDLILARHVTAAAREEEAPLRDAFAAASLPMLVACWDGTAIGRLLFVNPALCRLTGLSELDLLRSGIRSASGPTSTPHRQPPPGRQPGVFDELQTWVHADGHEMHVRATISRGSAQAGEPEAVIAYIREVSIPVARRSRVAALPDQRR